MKFYKKKLRLFFDVMFLLIFRFCNWKTLSLIFVCVRHLLGAKMADQAFEVDLTKPLVFQVRFLPYYFIYLFIYFQFFSTVKLLKFIIILFC